MADLRNPEFEAEKNKYKQFLDGYEKATKETVDEYIKVFSLNWAARNDTAKVMIALSSALLALTASGTVFKSLPDKLTPLMFAEWVLLLFAINYGLASLWFHIIVTKARILFLEQRPQFIKKVDEMLQHGRFEPEFFNGLFFAPFSKIYKYDKWSFRCLLISLISFSCSLFLLALLGWASFAPSFPKASTNLSNASAPQSPGTTTCAGPKAKKQ